MATEAFLFHDGGQTTAAVDLSVNLNGPNNSGQFMCVNLTNAGRTVNIMTAAGSQVYGILQNTPKGSQAADVGVLGISKAVAGGSFAAGTILVADSSGRLVAKTMLSLQFAVAIAMESSAAAGNIVTVYVNPALVATIN